MPSTSSSRLAFGIAASSPPWPTSRTGASARATRCAQACETSSGRTAVTTSAPACCTRNRPSGSRTATAWHSSGSSRSSASRHTSSTPTRGPSRSRLTTPGSERRRRAPSSTTTTLGSSSSARSAPARARARAVTSADSSASRRATVSVSVPISTAVSCPSRGRQCGSQRTHSQSGRAAGSVSTTMRRSCGLCSTAACPTTQRASRRGASAGPARPSTPRCPSAMVTGTSRAVQVTVRSCSGRSGSCTRTSEGRSAVPTRSSSRSGSCRRRSHSRRRGPVAVSSRAAGSGQSRRRAVRSASRAAEASCSTRCVRWRNSASCARCERRPFLRSTSALPTKATGDSTPSSR